MGTRGPAPKRSDQRRRTNDPEGGPVRHAEGAAVVEAPAADPEWHPLAVEFYESLTESGQATFYEPSDWALARFLCESMSRDLSEQVVGVTERDGVLRDVIPLKGASLSAYLRAFTALGVTEADRRRMGVELTRPKPKDPEDEEADGVVVDIAARLGGAGG